jgi:glycosyltransferase involved in cell wall biosynthesis
MPQASVNIATHSRPHLLPRAVESAFSAGTDVEVVVVDDASTDRTAEVCRSLPSIRYVRADRNQRVAGARNLGIMASTGEYLAFLDDDDLRLPGSLDLQVRELEATPEAGLVYGKAILADPDGVPTQTIEPEICPRGDIFWQLLEFNFIHCLAAVFRRSSIYRVGLLDTSLPGMDDWDLWVRIAEVFPVAVVDEPVGMWRSFNPDSDQGSVRMPEIFLQANYVQRSKWLRLPRALAATEEERQQVRQRLRNRFSDLLICYAASVLPGGHHRMAKKCLLSALHINPVRAIRPWTLRLLAQSVFAGSHEEMKANRPVTGS